MQETTKNTLNIVWEVLNGAIFDLTEGDPSDALAAVEECRDLIEELLQPPEGV